MGRERGGVRRKPRGLAGAIGSVALCLLALPGLAQADTFNVTSTADTDTAGTLRNAINQANASMPASDITFDPSLAGQTIVLGGTQLPIITSAITINTVSPVSGITINGIGTSRAFSVSTGNLSIEKLRITQAGSSTGGAIFSQGTVIVVDSTFEGNGASFSGGAIYSSGSLTVLRSTFTGNSVSGSNGGAIETAGGTAKIYTSTFTGNAAPYVIYNGGGTIEIYNSTIAGNVDPATDPNTAGFGIGGAISTSTQIQSTLISEAHGHACPVSSDIFSAGNNTIESTASPCGISGGDLAVSNAAALDLQPLADYGGATKTVALGPESVAIDNGRETTYSVDQRGNSLQNDLTGYPLTTPLTNADATDVGAFEVYDGDSDGVDDALDSCPDTGGNTASGCPAVSRSVSLKYTKKRKTFKGTIAAGPDECVADMEVKIKRRAKTFGTVESKPDGSFKLRKKAKKGVYRAEVSAVLVPGVAECRAAKSNKVRVRKP